MNSSIENIERYYHIRKAEFGFIERIELVQNVKPEKWSGFELTIVLRSNTDFSAPILRLDFTGVQDVRIGELAGLLRYMIEIRNIEDMLLEGRRYRITESEYDAISFECSAFTFRSETGS